MKVLIVGAGFSGATVARILAESGHDVTVVDKRDHIGGNAFDYENEYGIRVHKYGPHIFHTKNEAVWNFLNRFSTWTHYEHRVRAFVSRDRTVPFPPNKDTLDWVPKDDLVSVFYRPYTEKMWGRPLEQVSPKILDRVPIREDREDRYFPNDPHQGFPVNGYTKLIEVMLDHDNIMLRTEVSRSMIENCWGPWDHVFTSEPIDEFFGYCRGELPYRSLKFSTVTIQAHACRPLIPAATCNYTDRGPYTRVTEWASFPYHSPYSFFSDRWSTLTFETPYSPGRYDEKYYPVVDNDSRKLYKEYVAMTPPGVTFIGRLGNFAYLDMDQAVSSAMGAARKFLSENG